MPDEDQDNGGGEDEGGTVAEEDGSEAEGDFFLAAGDEGDGERIAARRAKRFMSAPEGAAELRRKKIIGPPPDRQPRR
jgi:hypothetical protein